MHKGLTVKRRKIMKFLGTKKANVNEVITYQYVLNMDDKEATEFTAFVKSLFSLKESVHSFDINMKNIVITINGQGRFITREFEEEIKVFDKYIKRQFNGNGLGITRTVYFDNLLFIESIELAKKL